METDTSIAVRYWISTDQPKGFPDLDGIGEFRESLAADYISVVKGRPAGAGGLVRLLVEIISIFSLSHVVQLLLDGIAYDLIKEGTHSFVLRPFIGAYKKLKNRNRERYLDIGDLRIEFQDCQVVIHGISSCTMDEQLERILLALAQNYQNLALQSGEFPFAIHIPVFEDPDAERPCKFRVVGDMGETISSSGPDDYLGHWGLVYDRGSTVRVYDVAHRLLIDERFNTLEEHWRELSWREMAKMRAAKHE